MSRFHIDMDDLIRTAAFQWLVKQVALHGGILPRTLLDQGFSFHGQRITLTGPQGIWKPAAMELPLSITTKKDGPYDDLILEDGFLVYRYRGTDPTHRDNIGLREAMHRRMPLIYFYGVEPGKYLAEWPVFIEDDHPSELSFIVSIGERSHILNQPEVQNSQYVAEGEGIIYRRYTTTRAIHRLHQGEFRIKVLSAYGEQCAFCRLRHQQLLDAAHIIPDNEEGGDPIVPNGLSLCKIHHAAFDGNIIGVNPDYKINIREDVLNEIDGPMLEYGIQKMHEKKLILPSNRKNWPDQHRLEVRFKRFKQAG